MKNSVSFSFKDDDFPPLASPVLQNHRSVSNNVILALILPNLFTRRNSMSDVGLVRTMSVILLLVIITLTFAIFVALWHIIIHNLNVDVQHVNVSSCDRHPSDSCFHNRVNGVKSSETVCDLSVHDDVITDFYCKITSQSMKSVLPLKSVHKSMSSKRLSRASATTSL